MNHKDIVTEMNADDGRRYRITKEYDSADIPFYRLYRGSIRHDFTVLGDFITVTEAIDAATKINGGEIGNAKKD